MQESIKLTNCQLLIEQKLTNIKILCDKLFPYTIYGKIISAIGTVVTAKLPNVKIGDLCLIFEPYHTSIKNEGLKAEVVAINNDEVKLLPFGNIYNLSKNCLIKKLDTQLAIMLNEDILGKIVDGFGNITGILNNQVTNTVKPLEKYHLYNDAPNPLNRPIITQQFMTGIDCIDLFLSCGIGQRFGIFAQAGVGKTTILGMLVRNAFADVIVICLVGERGREVHEFIELELNSQIKSKVVLVLATADKPPVEQIKCIYSAQAIAEYFRDHGKNVLLMVDSVTRIARAQREIGLSSGELPTYGGYPPSVFQLFPKIFERSGCNQYGSITSFYTILLEDKDIQKDVIAQEVKSILDGHIVLSYKLATDNHYPAIDVLKSLSRIANRIINPKHLQTINHIRLLLAKYQELEFLVRIGEYKKGQIALNDEAINKYNSIMDILKQTPNSTPEFDYKLKKLEDLIQPLPKQ